MSEIIFKRLFEVRILHGYYLDNWFADASGKKAVFQDYGANAADKTKNQHFILENKYNILQDISIEPTAETQRLIQQFRMRWRTTPTGFFVGLEVSRENAGAAAKFFPKIQLPPDIHWSFLLRSKNALLQSFTNHALRPTLPARYHFTNLVPAGEAKTFPSLSMHLPLFNSIDDRTWEMGELMRSGSAVKAAEQDTESGNDFIKVFDFNKNWHHYAHSFDRKVLPKSFVYRFDPRFNPDTQPVLSAEFSLHTLDGTLVKTISQTYTAAAPAPVLLPLDFQYQPIPPNATEEEKLKPIPIGDGWYTFKVKINNAAFESRNVLLHTETGTGSQVFGLVDISSSATQPQFNLFHGDGSLNVQPVPDANPLRWQGPVFEVRLLGRFTYWQYQLAKPINPAPTDPDFLYSNNFQTVKTKEPRRFVALRVPVKVNVPGTDIQLPTPEPASLQYDFQKKQYITETFLSTF